MPEMPVTGVEEQGAILLGEELDPERMTAGPFNIPGDDSERNASEFFWMMAKVGRLKSVLEIGSREGAGLRMMSQFCEKGARICSIDAGISHPEWQNGRDTVLGLHRTIDELCKAGFDASYHHGNSHNQPALDFALSKGPFDYVFIDADHRYIAVRNDWERYGKLGKIVGFHDIAQLSVAKLWNEIKASGKTTEEMIAPDATGIGLVWME